MPETRNINLAATDDIHTSVLLRQIIQGAPADHFTLYWLMEHLPKRSFGVILLFLAIISLLPVISIPARLLILVLTFQIIIGYDAPSLPRRLLKRNLASRHLHRLESHAIPLLEHLEKMVRPRGQLFLRSVRRVAALVALLLTILSLAAPIPFSNVPPSCICILMALAYIEHDGALLLISLIMAAALFAVVFCMSVFA